MKVKVIKPSRLNGMDVAPGEEVEISDPLAKAWILSGRAKKVVLSRSAPPKKKKSSGRGKRKNTLEKAVKRTGEKAVKYPKPEAEPGAAGKPEEE